MRRWRKKKDPIAPGDDICPTPAPVDEDPPADRFCDLVLTGGVASGVVYPWAIVEVARAYRFRNIGGTSVGAMAAALAAAAEYGRRTGFESPFEALRRIPAALGEVLPDGRTRMLSLFQANARGKRLVTLWGRLGRGCDEHERDQEKSGLALIWFYAKETLRTFGLPAIGGALAGLAFACLPWLLGDASAATRPSASAFVLMLLGTLIGAVLGLLWAVWSDIRHGLIANGYGLCTGATLETPGPEGKRPGLSEWLHDGIQLSAGLKKKDRPLTFRDLWSAPAYPGAPPRPCGPDEPHSRRTINLQMITTNVTHGRPYRLPLEDATSRLYFKREELAQYFHEDILDALVDAARPYTPISLSDPPADARTAGFLELPGADLPVVVAARLSLSFPLLFSAIPLWAVDYEAPDAVRTLKRCQFTDGGASSNFPIHLFDAALPSWPTFGFWLDRKGSYRASQDVWFPERLDEGWGDEWDRFDPLSKADGGGASSPEDSKLHTKHFFGFIGAIVKSAVDWRDRTSFRLPHVRNRVARLKLGTGEGGLNIGMSRKQILLMAHRYGTVAGKEFVKRFEGQRESASQAWSEHRWVRLALLIEGLRERLSGLSGSTAWSAYTVPMDKAIDQAFRSDPIRGSAGSKPDKEQAASLTFLLSELQRLEGLLKAAPAQSVKLVPVPELRMRAPL